MDVLQKCASPPPGAPEEMKASAGELDAIAFKLARGVWDCEALDEVDGAAFFRDRFKQGLEHPLAYAAALWYVSRIPDGRKGKVDGLSTLQSVLVDDIREQVRDGSALRDVLIWSANSLQRVALTGDVAFFSKTLPRALNEIEKDSDKFQRTTKQWINRAWIPLALWQSIHDWQEAYDICIRAKNCLPNAKLLEEEDKYMVFYRAWSKFKPTRPRESGI